MTVLSCDDIRQTLSAGATLLDVRNTNEFDANRLPNARNIPLSILPLLADQHFQKDDSLLIYCQSGARAVMAEQVLAKLGFTDVTNIGGIQHYSHCH